MTLIVILLVMAGERYWHPYAASTPFSSLLSWRDMLAVRYGRLAWFNGAVGVLLTVLPLVFLIALMQAGLAGEGLLLGLLALIFSLLVLIGCIGEQRFGAQVKEYMAIVARGDLSAVTAYLQGITRRRFPADTLRQLNRGFLGLMMIRMNERVLALLFWFVVLGPLGAVLYRSVTQLQGTALTTEDRARQSDIDSFQVAARRLKGIMDWLPTRLTALCYALIGSFTDVMPWWRDVAQQRGDDWAEANEQLLLNVGISALQIQDHYAGDAGELDPQRASEHVVAVRALSRRTLLVWVTVLALMTLAGWLH